MYRIGILVGSLLLATAVYAGEDKPTLDTDPNLVGWWKFDETAGTVAADSSRFQRNGTLKGELTFDKGSAPGRMGNALRLEGKDALVEVAKYKGVTGTRPRTVAVWIKTASSRGEIVSWGTPDAGQMFTFGFIRGRVGITPRGGYYYMNPETHDDEWHHVVAVVREAELPNLYENVALYLDGEVAEIHDIGLLDLWPIETGSELDVRIGRGYSGLLDDLRIYDRPLTDREIATLFKLQSNRPSTSSQ
jgi:hypothetical protein